MFPFFSIIVVSYNAGKKIKETIDSIIMQTNENYEIIVKDAMSTDDTLNNIPNSSRIKVFSNKDEGIYFGMNEAIDYSSGRYICFLNCGDKFENDNVLESVYSLVRSGEEPGIVYGDYKRNGVVYTPVKKITDFYLYRTSLCHQSMFIKRDMFMQYGKYDTTYKICADWHHTVMLRKLGVPFVYCSNTICIYEGFGISESKSGIAYRREELKRIRDEFYSFSQKKRYDLYLVLSFKKIRQKLASDDAPVVIRKLYRAIVNMWNKK